MQIIFAEIFVPKDFTIRLLLGSVDPQTRIKRYSGVPNTVSRAGDYRLFKLTSNRPLVIHSSWCPGECHAFIFERQSLVTKRQGF